MKVLDVAIVFRILYFITKANGLLPISISFNPFTVRNSFLDLLYSILFSLILIICLSCSQSNIIGFIGILQNPKQTIIFVFLAQVICSALRILAIYVSQVFNHKVVATFINRSVHINEMFVYSNRHRPFLDLKLSKWCLSKLIAMIFQVFLMLIPSVGFVSVIKSSENFLFLLICFMFILYTHMVLILSTGIYFCGMIVLGQFYRNLNSRILKLVKKCRLSNGKSNSFYRGMQRCCNLSDELDKLTCLYSEITNHAKLFNKYQRCFMIFSLTQYFVILLAEVCMYVLKRFKFFMETLIDTF